MGSDIFDYLHDMVAKITKKIKKNPKKYIEFIS